MKYPQIPDDASLAELQRYQEAVCKLRGWDQSSDLSCFLLFTEEVGELAKAIRNRLDLFQEGNSQVDTAQELADEMADVLGYLLDLANRFEVDLDQAYRSKEAKNAKRKWN